MTNISDNPGETWATMVSRHGKKLAVQPNHHENLQAQSLANKAMAIIQQSLTTDSVLFSFPKGLFSDRILAYKQIQQQISSNVEFRPLSLYDDRADGSLLLETKFSDAMDSEKAQFEDVTIEGVVFKVLPTGNRAKIGEFTHVQFTLLRMVDQSTLLHDLIESLLYYGEVLQVKKLSRMTWGS
ncbi:hypothetical protein [Parasitella parasitica]|uniref:Uncharacterized protein n=1 Tax=Parasitella parasitica TaxID=35722 RepID=A0A0B7NPB2_9FUNG|nr:hypothetical protein [Parasitella parasitica]